MLTFLRRLRARLTYRHFEEDLRVEMETHRAMAEDDLCASGLARSEAGRQSRRLLGHVMSARDASRRVWLSRWLDTSWQDVRIAGRTLRKQKLVTAAIAASLALGIGATSTAFSLVKSFLLAPLPYPDANRLVAIHSVTEERPGEALSAAAPDYLAWRARATSFDEMGTMQSGTGDLGAAENGQPAERVPFQYFTVSMFRVLGVSPALGRAFNEGEDPVGVPAPVAIISDEFWRRRYGASPDVLGQTLRLDGRVLEIVGVMPPGFAFRDERGVVLWQPLSFNARQVQGSAHAFRVTGRLKSGLTREHAHDELVSIASQLATEVPTRNRGWSVRIEPLQSAMFGAYRAPLLLLQLVVAAVLLIACANVAGLLLTRASSRGTEVSLRAALGATGSRIVRQLLTESVVLASVGGVGGIALAWFSLRILKATSIPGMPRLDHVELDTAVLACTAAITVATGLLFGILPALQSSRVDLQTGLRLNTRGTFDSPTKSRLRATVAAVQIALAVVLLLAAGLLIKTFGALQSLPLGGDPHNVLAFELAFPSTVVLKGVGMYDGFPLAEVSPIPARTFAEVTERLRRLPGVQSASSINHLPFAGGGPPLRFVHVGRPVPTDERGRQALTARFDQTVPGYFSTMGIRLMRGRDLAETDTASSPWVAVINQTMAQRFWPNEDPMGQSLQGTLVPDEQPREIVGIVSDVRGSLYETAPVPTVYTPYVQQPPHSRGPYGDERIVMGFVMRTSASAASMTSVVQRLMADIDPERPVRSVRRLEDYLGEQFAAPRFMTAVLSVFALVATFLAAIGVYGVLAFATAQRQREFGIRLALGASRGHVLALLSRQAISFPLIGLAAGLVIAQLSSRAMAALLPGTPALDATLYLIVGSVVVSVCISAAVVPAYRALTVAPTEVLRQE